MDGFLYHDDVENGQTNITRLALTEESLNRTLLNNGEKHSKINCWLSMYILMGSIVVIVVIILIIIAYKHLI
jgi:heme/copper-type cytochrome/quinol oxidase subunit 2